MNVGCLWLFDNGAKVYQGPRLGDQLDRVSVCDMVTVDRGSNCVFVAECGLLCFEYFTFTCYNIVNSLFSLPTCQQHIQQPGQWPYTSTL